MIGTLKINCCKNNNNSDSKHSRINKIRDLGKKAMNTRKNDINEMINTFKNIGTSEINRTKMIITEHKHVIFEYNEPEIMQVEPEIINDDSYFEK